MCFPTFTALGSFLLLCSFILELFIMIGNLTNTSFLRSIYFAEAWNTGQNRSYTFGLWNYCTGDGYGNISGCGSRSPAFDWTTTPTISGVVPNQSNSSVVHGIFIAMFILFFIGCGLSFVFWVLSLPICCMKRRGAWGYSMSTLVFINFLVMIAALILALITILSGTKSIGNSNSGWNAHAGNSLWLTIGACVALLLAFLCYTGGSVCGRKKKTRKGAVDPNYKDPYATGQPYAGQAYTGQSNHGTPLFVPSQTAQTGTMLQQPYAVSPSVGHQHLSPAAGHQNLRSNLGNQNLNSDLGNQNLNSNVGHQSVYTTPNVGNQQLYEPNVNQGYDASAAQNYDTSAAQNYDPNSVSVPMHGYQTPTLQPANTHS